MRRNARNRKNDTYFKNLLFWSGAVLLLAVTTFGITYAIYSSKVKSEARVGQFNTKSIGELVPNKNEEDETKSASFSLGKTVNEVKQDMEEKIEDNIVEQKYDMVFYEEKEDETLENNTEETILNDEKPEIIEEPQQEELHFEIPVKGDILREFAKEKLVYSDTLKEWVIHLGIDIKAMKTSVVKSAEAGVVKSIKNDPRYGTTVIVEHRYGFKTVYSNLLTAEFVSENEEIAKGQSIGTVGSSANFEIADEAHLHFEIWKDGEAVDPNLYLK